MRFPAKIVLLLLVISVFEFYPIALGRTPLPINKINQFPIYGPHDPVYGPDNGDLVTQIYPWRMLAAESIRKGQWPLWNPRILSGTPFVANSQSAVFYPMNYLFYFLPSHIAWSIAI